MNGIRHNDDVESAQRDGELLVNAGREMEGQVGKKHRSGDRSPSPGLSEGNTGTSSGKNVSPSSACDSRQVGATLGRAVCIHM